MKIASWSAERQQHPSQHFTKFEYDTEKGRPVQDHRKHIRNMVAKGKVAVTLNTMVYWEKKVKEKVTCPVFVCLLLIGIFNRFHE